VLYIFETQTTCSGAVPVQLAIGTAMLYQLLSWAGFAAIGTNDHQCSELCSEYMDLKPPALWPTRYSFTSYLCARINHPFITPAHTHYPHYCNTIARLLRNV